MASDISDVRFQRNLMPRIDSPESITLGIDTLHLPGSNLCFKKNRGVKGHLKKKKKTNNNKKKVQLLSHRVNPSFQLFTRTPEQSLLRRGSGTESKYRSGKTKILGPVSEGRITYDWTIVWQTSPALHPTKELLLTKPTTLKIT